MFIGRKKAGNYFTWTTWTMVFNQFCYVQNIDIWTFEKMANK